MGGVVMWKALIQIIEKWGCHHEWTLWKDVSVESYDGSTWHIFHFYCKKCGKFKKVKSI